MGERAASPRSSSRHLLAFPSATFTLLTRTSYVCPPVCLRLPSPLFPHELPTCVPHPPPPPRPPLPLSTASPPSLSSSTFHRWNPSIRRRTLVVRQWYPGVVEGFEVEGNTHRVHFDDDEHVSLHLDRMQVRQRGARRGNERERGGREEGTRERERERTQRDGATGRRSDRPPGVCCSVVIIQCVRHDTHILYNPPPIYSYLPPPPPHTRSSTHDTHDTHDTHKVGAGRRGGSNRGQPPQSPTTPTHASHLLHRPAYVQLYLHCHCQPLPPPPHSGRGGGRSRGGGRGGGRRGRGGRRDGRSSGE